LQSLHRQDKAAMSFWTAFPEEERTMTIQTANNNNKHIATIQNTKPEFWAH
jgi:hypothetical protein